MTKVLLTGASGFIGKHITLQLLAAGYDVRASVRNNAKADEVRAAVAPHLPEGFDLGDHLEFVLLDLESDSGWDQAISGIDVLMHTASPFPIASPKDENELIRPAVEGTLRALRAAHKAGVKRVILTSSVAAVYGNDLPAGATKFNETFWTNVEHPIGRIPYTKSKTLAEKAAWDYIAAEAPELELTTVNPVLVTGAPLDKHFGSSVSVIQRVLSGKDPVLPDVMFSLVDVKDVAAMHVKSIGLEAAKGQRFIASSEDKTFVDIAKTIKAAYPQRKISTTLAPNLLLRFLGLFDGEIRALWPSLGKHTGIDSTKARTVLGIDFISAEQSLVETAKYVVENGFVKA